MGNKKKVYCAYCKDEVYEEDMTLSGSEVYHRDCLEQKECHMDEFGDNIGEEEF